MCLVGTDVRRGQSTQIVGGTTRFGPSDDVLASEDCRRVRALTVWIQSYSVTVGKRYPNQSHYPLEYGPESKKYSVSKCVIELPTSMSAYIHPMMGIRRTDLHS